VFELDNSTTGANAIDESDTDDATASSPDDWARNNFPNLGQCFDLENNELDINSCGYVAGPNVDPANPGGSAFRSLFIQDPNGVGNNDDIFIGGGSKDDLDVSQWQWTFGSAPDKDDLLPIGAAAYLQDIDADNEDELLIYLFGTLFAPNGTAAIGAWLFKKNIGTCAGGSFGVVDDEGNCIADQPAELHTVGDVIVVSETTNGGRVVQMQVFKWVGSDAAAKADCVADGFTLESPKNSLCKVLDEANALCTDALVGDDDACGSMNLGTVKQGQVTLLGSPTESPDDWGFQSKFPPPDGAPSPAGTDGIGSDDFPETSLFEAGFNFSNLFEGEVGCFNSFLMNTRSSHEVRAQLKDLALGSFPLCGIKVEKTGDTLGKIGDPVDYIITVTNIGAITLTRDSIVDSLLGDLAGTPNPGVVVTSSDCGATLAAGVSCTIEATRTVVEGDPDPLPNTVTVVYSSGGDEATDEASHEVELFQPSVVIDKTANCDAAGVTAGADITYSYLITNTSSDDSPNLILAANGVNDDKLGDLTALASANGCASLAPGAFCSFNQPYTTTAADVGTITNTVDVLYSPRPFENPITDDDTQDCLVLAPNPAFVVIEKELRNGDNLAFNYSATGLPEASYVLTPQFGNLPLSDPFISPFPAVGAGNSFATTDPEIVNFDLIGDTKPVSVEELLPLPPSVDFVSLDCEAVQGTPLIAEIGRTANLTLSSGNVVFCRYVNEVQLGEQGCTPGYWKVPQHHDSWEETPYTPSTVLNDVFDFPAGGPVAGLAGDTMLQALNYPGGNGLKGAAQILLRAAVAAVLNAAHPDVNYSITLAQVIFDVNTALNSGSRDDMLALAGTLDQANNGVLDDNANSESCPLN
jgi:hypothetical protein